MSRLELLCETNEAVVIRMNCEQGGRTDDQQRGVVIYVPPSAERGNVARQLRGVAEVLERPAGRIPLHPTT